MLGRTLAIAVLAAVFVYGIAHLFFLRFESGDVYPEYSSLRADPLGTKGVYDALTEFQHLEVRRNYRPVSRLRASVPMTLIYTGASEHAFFDKDELETVEKLLAAGSRVVVTFFPVARGPSKRDLQHQDERERDVKKKRRAKTEGKEKPSDEEEEKSSGAELIAFKTVAEKWGFSFDYLQDESTFHRVAILADERAPLEPKISWHSALCFQPEQTSEWKRLYTCEEQPAVIERAYGNGTIVLCADSYFLSNEALRKERTPKFLSWLMGSSRVVVFDEESHGVREEPGLVSLVRKYRLQGAVVALVVLAILFVWKNGVPLVPPHPELEASGEHVAGKDAAEGFVNLLRRSIGSREILQACAEEWGKSFNHDCRNSKAARLQHVLGSDEAKRDPVAAYRLISRELARR